MFWPDAWIITGGLNKGIDDFIGSEVAQKLTSLDKIPRAILGISNWDCLAKKKDDLLKVKYCLFLLSNKTMRHHKIEAYDL